MSSFFTIPASQRKRKRDDRVAAPGSKKRGIAAKADDSKAQKHRRQEEDDDDSIITGSESESEDENGSESGLSESATSDDSDAGETAAERRLKLAERYLENIREEVDDVGFDAAEIDRDLIAERLKDDVVRGYSKKSGLVSSGSNCFDCCYRTKQKVVSFEKSHQNSILAVHHTRFFAPILKVLLLLPSTHLLPTPFQKTELLLNGS